jgi:ribosomal protein S18 acetylase RimI-like enzyme
MKRAVTLVPLADRDAFVREEIANYAEEQIRDAAWSRSGALERARAEFLPELEAGLAEADAEEGHDIWSAIDEGGATVGWLWVRRNSPRSAFLCQITVAESRRRLGYGRGMLAALEERLARNGVDELLLRVNVANGPARRLYAAAGYEQLEDDGRVCRLRKRVG